MTNKEVLKFYNTIVETSELIELSEKQLNITKEILDMCCNLYYNSPLLVLQDYQYDTLYNIYTKYRIYSYGAEPSKKSISTKHEYPELVGSLEKANSMDDLREWFLKLFKTTDRVSVRGSIKYDGNSVVISTASEVDESGFVPIKQALTRGKNGKGANITPYFKHIKFPQGFENAGIKFEAMCTFKNFEKVLDKSKKEYVNPRNCVSGILSDLQGVKVSKYIQLVPINMIQNGKFQPIKKLNKLYDKSIIGEFRKYFLKFKYWQYEMSVEDLLDEIEQEYLNKIELNKSDERLYDFDGLVFELIDLDVRKKLGRKETGAQFTDNFSVALKFPYAIEQTKLKKVKWDVGKTGIYTPVAVYDKVSFNGNECTKTSLSNYERFKKLRLHKGDELMIEYRNQCLAYVNKPDNNYNQQQSEMKKLIKSPETCDFCLEPLVVRGAFLCCENEDCQSHIEGKILTYVIKIGIKNINEQLINRLHVSGLLNSIEDLYKLEVSDLLQIEGFKEKSATNLINDISKVKKVRDWELIGSLSIRNFSRKKARLLLTKITLKDLFYLLQYRDKFIKRIVEVEGFQHTTADYIYDGLKSNKKLITTLSKYLTVEDSVLKEDNKNQLTVVITGDIQLNTQFTKRSEMTEYIESLGHKVVGSVSSKTDYLITDEISATTKSKRALELKIPIIKTNQLDILK